MSPYESGATALVADICSGKVSCSEAVEACIARSDARDAVTR